MLRNYLSIFYRTFKKQRTHTIINILGLGLGLASAMLISLYVVNELNFNSMHHNPDRTFRLGLGLVEKNGNIDKGRYVPGGWVRRIKEESPEVEQTTRLLHIGFPTTIRNQKDDKSVLTDDRRWVEPELIKVLSIDLIKGSKEKFLEQTNSMVLSERAARELFGDQDPLGEILTVNDKEGTNGEDLAMVVTGVYKDFPANSTFQQHYLLNLASLRPYIKNYDQYLEEQNFEAYVVLKEGASKEKFLDYVNKVLCTEAKSKYAQYFTDIFPIAVSLPELHFNNETTWEFKATIGDKKYLIILSIIGALVLIVACINYMNLATAKASLRAKEVGIRKSFGSSRGRLALQFFIESGIIAGIAFALALALAILLLPPFNTMSGKLFTPADIMQPDTILIYSLITLFAALIGGSYPAIVLSGFKPIAVLKGNVSGTRKGQLFRKSLMTIQYAVSISLTIIAIVIFRQVGLMHDSKLNEHGDQIMMIRFGSTVPYFKFAPFKAALRQDPDIDEVSIGDSFPRMDHWGEPMMDVVVSGVSDQKMQWNQLLVDFDFPRIFNLSTVAGRAFDPNNVNDSLNIMVNEAAVRSLHLTNEQAVGQVASIAIWMSNDKPNEIVQRKIIGVVKDFAYKNMRFNINPLILYPNPNLHGYKDGTMVYVKLPKDKIQEKIQFVENTWKKTLPDIGLQYFFVNDFFTRLYKSEMTISSLSLNFSVLAILITMFGLFGLASFAAERRTKEIGVRKVHGASVAEIASLLIMSFVKIFLLAAIIVVPLNYYILKDWLTRYKYQTSLDVFVFGSALGLILFITLITVTYETLKAAMSNPIKSLKHE